MPVTRLLVAQPRPFFRQWPQTLGQQQGLVGQDRQFAGLGVKQGAARRDNVTDIPLFEILVYPFRQTITLESHLDLAGTVRELDETCFAHDALDHHAARDSNLYTLFREGLVVMPAIHVMQLVGERIPMEVVRERVATLSQRRQLLAPLCD